MCESTALHKKTTARHLENRNLRLTFVSLFSRMKTY
uniref:Uncharacterized protein n=1 Tax=Anguilla anguilla TaxID=7936 RepID=A0A0E9XP17_ANGAN